MDILIKNMGKPKSCDDCRFTEQGQGYSICAITGNYAIDSTYKSCPLVALPSHGRLIDASELETYYSDIEADNGTYTEDAGETLRTIQNAPTIVEAST